MKNFLLFCFLLLAGSTKLQAQPYPSIFGRDSTVWYVYVDAFDGGIPYVAPTLIHTIKNDTIFEGKRYKKVTTTASRSTFPVPLFLIREDLNTGKVWSRYPTSMDSTERLLIDFTMNVGDTFKRVPNSLLHSIIVDSVYYDLEGRKHIRFNDISNLWDHSAPYDGVKPEFITGIGNNWGLRYNICHGCLPIDAGLICAYKDREQVYKDTSSVFGNNCIYPLTLALTNPKKEKTAFQIAPNPVTENLSVTLPAGALSAIVYNVAGQKMWALSGSTQSLKIDCSQWPSGLYVLRLQDKSGSVSSQTFLKQ